MHMRTYTHIHLHYVLYVYTYIQYCMGWKPAAGASVQAMRTSSSCYGGITLQASMFCAR